MTLTLRDTGRFDIFLTHSGVALGYVIADKDGSLQYAPGFVEEVAPQQTIGAFTYDALPSTISSILAFEDWSGGAGEDTAESTAGQLSFLKTTTPTNKYSYSQHADASWGSVVYKSPAKQVMTGVTTAFTKIVVASTGVYAIGGRYVYKLHAAGSTAWDVSLDGGAGNSFTDLIEYNNGTSVFLCAALGDAVDFQYSTNGGTSWTASTGNKYSYFTIHGNSTVIPVLWACTSTGLLVSSTNVTAVSNAARVAGLGGTVNGIIGIAGNVWAFRTDGIGYYTGSAWVDFLPLPTLTQATNGKNPYVWIDQRVYVGYGAHFLAIDPIAFTVSTVFLPQHPELNGAITAIGGDTLHLYFALKNGSGNTYLMKQNPSVGDPHTWAYLGANDCTAVASVGSAKGPSATNTVIMYAYGTTADYSVTPLAGLRPHEDTAYRFELADGVLYGPWADGGALAIPDYIDSLRAVVESCTPARTVAMGYGTNGDTTMNTNVLTAQQEGLTRANIATPAIFNRIRYIATLVTPDDQHSPQLRAVALDSAPIVPRHRQWTMTLKLEDQAIPRGGGDKSGVSLYNQFNHLMTAVQEGIQVTYDDYFGGTYTAKIRNVAGQGLTRKASGKGRGAQTLEMQVVISEIQPVSAPTGTFIYGQSAWAEGDTY